MWLGAILMIGFVFFLPGLFFFGLAIAIVVDLWLYALPWVALGVYLWLYYKIRGIKRRWQARKAPQETFLLSNEEIDYRPQDVEFIERHMRLAKDGNAL